MIKRMICGYEVPLYRKYSSGHDSLKIQKIYNNILFNLMKIYHIDMKIIFNYLIKLKTKKTKKYTVSPKKVVYFL